MSLADYRLFDDLSDETLGPLHGQDDWSSFGGGNAVVIDPADALNQCLYVPSESSVLRKALSAEGLAFPDGTSRMFFFRMRVANRQTFSVGLSPWTSPSEYSDFAPELGMANNTPNLDLRVWDDDGGNYEALVQLTPDTWYNVWVRVDTAGNYYEVWLNDVPGGVATAADKLAAPDGDETFDFRTGDNSALQNFYIKTSGGSSGFGPTYFDDIYLETSANLSLCNPTNLVFGDCDCDGTVGPADLAALPDCLLGPEIPSLDCTCLQSDDDEDVDLHDVSAFQLHYGN
ncbi:MAG: hypothetical protein PVJ57_16855 [Phycisphaerae bacterium]